ASVATTAKSAPRVFGYADDLALLSSSVENAQQQIGRLVEVASSVGLVFITLKIEVLNVLAGRHPSGPDLPRRRWANDQARTLPVVTYLGGVRTCLGGFPFDPSRPPVRSSARPPEGSVMWQAVVETILRGRFAQATSVVYNLIFGGLFDKQLQITELRDVVQVRTLPIFSEIRTGNQPAMPALYRTCFCAPILSCLIFAALCRQFQISDLGCFVDYSKNGIRDLDGMKNIGLTRIGSSGVSQVDYAINSGQMTHELCSSACALGGFRFAALQAIRWCYCGNSYGSLGAAPYWECGHVCSGNSSQNCGGEFRNRVLRLSYTGSSEDACMNRNVFVPGNRTFVELSFPDAPAFRTLQCAGLPECLYRCRSGCQAVIFSQLQRLCHLLEFAAVPAALSSASSGDFFQSKTSRPRPCISGAQLQSLYMTSKGTLNKSVTAADANSPRLILMLDVLGLQLILMLDVLGLQLILMLDVLGLQLILMLDVLGLQLILMLDVLGLQLILMLDVLGLQLILMLDVLGLQLILMLDVLGLQLILMLDTEHFFYQELRRADRIESRQWMQLMNFIRADSAVTALRRALRR
uniref:WSC domain-containing protein n=1 Tax=Macrostomum lignano TaxID=282301 RepID=A0A1I8GM60_9PLAT